MIMLVVTLLPSGEQVSLFVKDFSEALYELGPLKERCENLRLESFGGISPNDLDAIGFPEGVGEYYQGSEGFSEGYEEDDDDDWDYDDDEEEEDDG